jgi:hypothetical protein
MVRRLDSIGQESLDFSEPTVPVATMKNVEDVVDVLKTHGQLSAAEIAAKLGLPPSENSKRKIRAIARAARPEIVSFPASDGYKLWGQCTVAEIEACIASFDAVIRDTTATKMLFQNRLFSRGGQV